MSETGFRRRKVTKDISIPELRQMRQNGMTNKQIANSAGISISTVYRLIGKKSFDVANAEAQNKPCPISKVLEPAAIPYRPKIVADIPIAAEHQAEPVLEEEPKEDPEYLPPITQISTLHEIKRTVVLELCGQLCNYTVNCETGDVEMHDGVLTGLLDKFSLDVVIAELQEIRSKIKW